MLLSAGVAFEVPVAPPQVERPRARRAIALADVTEWREGRTSRRQDELAGEEPLEVRVNGETLGVVMRTPGHDRELVAGLLFSEGLLADHAGAERERFEIDPGRPGGNVIAVDLPAVRPEDLAPARRLLVTASSCGICGRASIEAVKERRRFPVPSGFSVDAAVLSDLPARMRGSQAVFARTGGLHAAALFTASGELVALREDIGRHNAVDKIVGWALLAGLLPCASHVLVVSGRGGFEIVQKAVTAGIPVLACVSAPSSLAVQLAREAGLTLAGFVRARRFVVYAGDDRVSGIEPL